LGDALGMLEAEALFEGEERPVFIRVAGIEDSTYIDLCDPDWRAIQVTKSGWEVVNEYPVYFRRVAGGAALPLPTRKGGLEELRRFVNLGSDDDYRLLVGWLLTSLRPPGQPYPLLILHGEQGSAKSTLARIARALVDPNEAPLRREPREPRDLIVAARNGWVVAFDNVSRLSQELSDDLARLATGSGFGARTLYTDLEETIVHVARPAILNGIEDFVTRGDLLDRSVILNLRPVERYRDEQVFWGEFEEARPAILGALLDAVATALARLGETPAPNSRMADFARWVTAAEPALDCGEGDFMRTYRENRAGAVLLVLEASNIAGAVQTLAETGFEGTASELLRRLGDLVDDDVKRERSWPKQAHVLAGRLRRIAPALRRVGVSVEFSRDRRARRLTITKIT